MNSHFTSTLILKNQGLIRIPDVPESIEYIDCSENDIEEINNLPKSVVYLDCSFNNLKNLDFLKDSNIQYLDIQGNKNIDFENIDLPENLRMLNCSYCKLSNLPNVKNITFLKCKGNKIKELNLRNSKLIGLDASKNYITNVDEIPETLAVINLSNNKLKSLPRLHDSILYLSLQDNKFDENNLPAIPTFFMFLGMSKNIFKNNKNIDQYTAIKYLNGDECDCSTFINYTEYMYMDKRDFNKNVDNIKCMDMIMGDEFNIKEYLTQNSNNIVIENNGTFYCYKRNELKKHVDLKTECGFINQIENYNTGETLYKLYMREYINKEDFKMITNRLFSIYKLETSRIIKVRGNNETVYKVNAFTVKEYLDIYH